MGNIIDTIEIADLDSSFYHINANSFSWIFENIRSLKQGVGRCVKSNKIDLEVNGEPEKWQVLLYPDGFSKRVEGYFSLWVKKLSDIERNVSLCCKIYNSESKLLVEKWTYDALTMESVLGWTTFCKRSIIEEDEIIQCNGTFRIDITVAFYTANKNTHQSLEDYDTDKVKRSTDVCNSLRSLLVAETFSDATVIAGDEEIKVHKAILSARSKVFQKLFKVGPKMEDSRKLTFDDLSKDAVKEMIRFVYAGEMGNVSFDVACELFDAADIYQMEILKEACSKILANNLNEDNVLRVLSLTERHNSKELKDSCLLYIVRNKVEVQKQKEWKELLKKDPKLANNVIEEFAKRQGAI